MAVPAVAGTGVVDDGAVVVVVSGRFVGRGTGFRIAGEDSLLKIGCRVGLSVG